MLRSCLSLCVILLVVPILTSGRKHRARSGLYHRGHARYLLVRLDDPGPWYRHDVVRGHPRAVHRSIKETGNDLEEGEGHPRVRVKKHPAVEPVMGGEVVVEEPVEAVKRKEFKGKEKAGGAKAKAEKGGYRWISTTYGLDLGDEHQANVDASLHLFSRFFCRTYLDRFVFQMDYYY